MRAYDRVGISPSQRNVAESFLRKRQFADTQMRTQEPLVFAPKAGKGTRPVLLPDEMMEEGLKMSSESEKPLNPEQTNYECKKDNSDEMKKEDDKDCEQIEPKKAEL